MPAPTGGMSISDYRNITYNLGLCKQLIVTLRVLLQHFYYSFFICCRRLAGVVLADKCYRFAVNGVLNFCKGRQFGYLFAVRTGRL